MQLSKLQELGLDMMGASWSTCVALSAGGVAAVSILSGLLPNAVRQVSFNIGNPLLFLGFLVTYGLPAALGIGIIAVLLKVLLFVSGRSLVWLGPRQSGAVPMPNISIPIHRSEFKKLFQIIERKVDQRSKILKKSGLGVEKRVGKNQHYSYRFSYRGRLLYHFSMMPRPDFGPNSVGFLDGWTEPKPNTYTAFGNIQATLAAPKPVLSLTNLSLLEHNGVPLQSGLIEYDELGERIWAKASRVIESGMRQVPIAAT